MFYNVKFPGTHINVRRLKGTGEINLITFYLNQYVQTIIVSSYNQHKKLLTRYILLFPESSLFDVYMTLVASFQVLSSHMWLTAAVLDSTLWKSHCQQIDKRLYPLGRVGKTKILLPEGKYMRTLKGTVYIN